MPQAIKLWVVVGFRRLAHLLNLSLSGRDATSSLNLGYPWELVLKSLTSLWELVLEEIRLLWRVVGPH